MLNDGNAKEIWTRLKDGDQQAFLELYKIHYVGLINYGIKLTGNRDLTKDCITQVLLKLWDKRKELAPVENVRSYLLTCLRRELYAELKSENRRFKSGRNLQKELDIEELPYEEYIIQLQTDELTRHRLLKAFEKLTEREKELLRLRFFEDLDYDAIALQCGITKRTAYNIIYHALQVLKADFADKTSEYNKTKKLVIPIIILMLIFC